MGFTSKFSVSEIRKGSIIRRFPEHLNEFFEVGDFHPELGGWELKPNGKDIYRWEGILLYLRPESVAGKFQLFKNEDE